MEKLKHRYPELWKFIKFNFTLIVTSALDLIIYTFLFYCVFTRFNEVPIKDNAFLSFLGIHYKGYLYAYGISTTLGYVAAYLMNRKLTFHSDVNPVGSSIQYAIMAFATIIFSTWLGGVVGTFMQEHSISNPFTELLAKFIVINIPTIWTYPLERFVIQRKKKRILAFAVDLDGTLLNDESKVTDENLEAITRLKEKGVKVIITTGRTVSEIPKVLRSNSDIAYIIYSNGAGIIDSNGKGIYTNGISKQQATEVYRILDKYDTFIELYADKKPRCKKEMLNLDTLTYFDVAPSYKRVIMKTRKGEESLENAIAAAENIEMFNVYFASREERALAILQLNKMGGLSVTTSSDNNLEIIVGGVDKGAALDYLCSELGIDKSQRIASGDSKNDLSMFANVKNGYAVSNACKELKEVSKKVICSNNENVAQYILRRIV